MRQFIDHFAGLTIPNTLVSLFVVSDLWLRYGVYPYILFFCWRPCAQTPLLLLPFGGFDLMVTLCVFYRASLAAARVFTLPRLSLPGPGLAAATTDHSPFLIFGFYGCSLGVARAGPPFAVCSVCYASGFAFISRGFGSAAG